jgi:hypothetical protein
LWLFCTFLFFLHREGNRSQHRVSRATTRGNLYQARTTGLGTGNPCILLFDFLFLKFFVCQTTRKGGVGSMQKKGHDQGQGGRIHARIGTWWVNESQGGAIQGQGSVLGWWCAWSSRDGVARGVGWDAEGSKMTAAV